MRTKPQTLTEQNADLRRTNAELLSVCGARTATIEKLQRENRDLAECVREATAAFRMDTMAEVRISVEAALKSMRLLDAEQAFHLLLILAAAYKITLSPPAPAFPTAQESK
jgi:hypothetical protein